MIHGTETILHDEAMRREACAFADYLKSELWYPSMYNGYWMNTKTYNRATTAELYEIFKKEQK